MTLYIYIYIYLTLLLDRIHAYCRLGFVINYLSRAAIVGFMGGAAITIGLQQLKGFLGIRNFTTHTDVVSVMKSVWRPVHHGVIKIQIILHLVDNY